MIFLQAEVEVVEVASPAEVAAASLAGAVAELNAGKRRCRVLRIKKIQTVYMITEFRGINIFLTNLVVTSV